MENKDNPLKKQFGQVTEKIVQILKKVDEQALGMLLSEISGIQS